MAASQRLYGSINLTKLLEEAKKGHSAFRRAESNGNIYVNVTQWINDKKDDKGNDSSITLASSKEKKDAEKRVYIGNLKISEGGGGDAPLNPEQAPDLAVNLDDLPF